MKIKTFNLTAVLCLIGWHVLSMAADKQLSKSHQRGAALSGFYTVGDPVSDFEDLASAFDAIELDGISGPVTLQLIPGTHWVHETLGEFIRWDQTDDLLSIQSLDSMNPAVLQHDALSASDNWVIKLNGVTYVEVKDLIFEAVGTADFASLLALENGSGHITISSNQFNSYNINPTSSVADGSSVVSLIPSGLSDIRISNNAFTGGNTAIYLSGPNPLLVEGVIITANRFTDQYAIGPFSAVVLNYVSDLTFHDNLINNVQSNGKGLRVFRADGAFITGNQVLMSGAGNGGIGMRLSNMNAGGVSTSQVSNNFILASHKGLVLDNLSQMVEVHHNSIVAHGSMGSVASYALQVATAAGAQIDIQNNLIHSTMTHPQATVINYAEAAVMAVVDNNIYHGLSSDPYLYDGVAYATVADYQLASGLDVNTLDKSVNYVDMFNGDLHLSPGQYNDPDLLVPATAGTIFDIDGETRLPYETHKGADDLDHDIIFAHDFDS